MTVLAFDAIHRTSHGRPEPFPPRGILPELPVIYQQHIDRDQNGAMSHADRGYLRAALDNVPEDADFVCLDWEHPLHRLLGRRRTHWLHVARATHHYRTAIDLVHDELPGALAGIWGIPMLRALVDSRWRREHDHRPLSDRSGVLFPAFYLGVNSSPAFHARGLRQCLEDVREDIPVVAFITDRFVGQGNDPDYYPVELFRQHAERLTQELADSGRETVGLALWASILEDSAQRRGFELGAHLDERLNILHKVTAAA